jgi:uncharacterized protein (TIGR02996 family)
MNPADALLAGALDQPDDPAPWLMLSDWLEEQGDPASLARAQLLRWHTQRVAAEDDPAQQNKLDEKAWSLLADHPGLLGAMQPLLEGPLATDPFPVLSVPTALAMFLLADYTSVIEGPLAAGSTWVGALSQRPCYSFPTTFWLQERKGNHFEGSMKEDFRSIHRRRATGTFYFRGVIAGRSHLAFVTYATKDHGIHPGLYQFHLNRLRLKGTWSVPNWKMRGTMFLEHKSGPQ